MVIDKSNAEHYIWGEVCDGWHLLKGDDLSIIAERVPAGASESRHFHSHARQFFYVLSGQAIIEMDGECFALNRGQGVEIPPGKPHQFINGSSEEVEFLVISQPTTRGDRFESALNV